MNVKVGDIVIYQKCACGESDLTVGKEYEVLAVKDSFIMFYDDNFNKRVKTLKNGCFYKKERVVNE